MIKQCSPTTLEDLPDFDTGVADNGDIPFSKGQDVEGQSTEQTELDLRQDKDLAKLIDKGKLKVETSDLVLETEKVNPEASQGQLFSEGETVQGQYQDGVATVFADNNSKDSALATAWHEVFHAAVDHLSPKVRQDLLNRLDKLTNNGKAKWVQDAKKAIPESTSETNIAEELGAYAVTQHTLKNSGLPNSVVQWVKDLINKVRASIYKTTGVLIGPMNPSMLKALAKSWKGEGVSARGDLKASVASDATMDTETKPFLDKKELLGRKTKIFDEIKRQIQRNFVRWGWTNEETHDLKVLADGRKNAGESELNYDVVNAQRDLAKAFNVKNYSDLSEQNVKDLDLALKTKNHSTLPKEVLDRLPEESLAVVEHLRSRVDQWSGEMTMAIEELMELKYNELSEAQQKVWDNPPEDGIPNNHPLVGMATLLEVIKSNEGEYLNRSYQAFDDKNWKKKIEENTELVGRAKEYFRDINLEQIAGKVIGHNATDRDAKIDAAKTYLDEGIASDLLSEKQIEKLDGLSPTLLSDSELTGKIGELLQEAKDKGEMSSLIANGQMYGSKDTSILKRRKAIDPIILELLGEYQDPLVNFTRSVSKMQWYVANHKFLVSLREQGLKDGFFKTDSLDFEYNSEMADRNTDTMNPLGGLYATADYKTGLGDLLGSPNSYGELVDKFISFNGMVKYGKVVVSPTTQFRNFFSAAMFVVHMGHNPMSVKNLKIAGRGTMSDLFSKDTEMKTYVNHLVEIGVLHNSAYAGEMKAVMDDFINNREPALINSKGIKGKWDSMNNWMQKSYQAGDDFWKIVAFEQEKQLWIEQEGMTDAEAEKIAAERVRNTMPTYSMLARAAMGLRRFPLVAPFVAFPYEILRTTYNSLQYMSQDYKAGRKGMAARRATGMAVSHSLFATMAVMSRAMLGITDDDDEVIRKLGPEYSRNSFNLYTGVDKDGNYNYIDTTFLDPYNIWMRPARALLNDNNTSLKDNFIDAASEFLSPFISPDITAGIIFETLTNDKRNGGSVYNEQAPLDEKLASSFTHIAKGLSPGVVGNIERTIKAATGTKSQTGREYELGDEALAFFGFRNFTMDLPQSLRYKSFQFKDDLRDAQQLLSRKASDRNIVSSDEIEDAFDNTLSSRDHTYKEIVTIIKHMRALGANDQSIKSGLIAGRFAKKDIALLMKGRIPKWRMSSQFLDSAVKGINASSLPSSEKLKARRMINQRKREIERLGRKQ